MIPLGREGFRLRGVALALAFAAAALWSSTPAASATSAPDEAALAAAAHVDDALERWDLPEAEALLADLRLSYGGSSAVPYVEGRLAFFRGDYERAREHLKESVDAGGAPSYFGRALALAEASAEATDDLDSHTSPDGKLILRVSPRDAVLVPYVEQAMPLIIDAVAERLGFRPSEPLRIELLPEVERLSAMTGLPVRAIHTSGTIAVCKFNRLMVTSPRALMRGYPWLDTVAHEYVHYAINHLSGGGVPIWLHEGLAKYIERTWRDPDEEGRLQPSMEHLLARALKSGKLIPFSKMHPSMALLPSQEEAALAFAEVFTVVDFLVDKTGWEGVRTALRAVRDGREAEDALSEAVKMPFGKLVASWRKSLDGRKLRLHKGMVTRGLAFRGEGDGGAEEKPVLGEIKTDKARKHLRLGELLREEGHTVAAVVELEKAHSADKGRSPVIGLKLGRAYLSLGVADRAVEVVRPLADAYASMVGIHKVLGIAYHGVLDEEAAERHLVEAVRINPFDPAVHATLVEVYTALGRTPDADREREALVLLRE